VRVHASAMLAGRWLQFAASHAINAGQLAIAIAAPPARPSGFVFSRLRPCRSNRQQAVPRYCRD